MDRNSIIGLFLIGFILIVFTIFNRQAPDEQPTAPPQERVTEDRKSEDPVKEYEKETFDDKVIDDPLIDNDLTYRFPEPFSNFEHGEEKFATLENDFIKITFSSYGGNIQKAELKKYNNYKGEAVVLSDFQNKDFGFNFFYKNRNIYTNALYFESPETVKYAKAGDNQSIIMKLAVSNNIYIEKIYTLHGDGYLLDYEVNWHGFDQILPRNVRYIELNWEDKLLQQEKNFEDEQSRTTVYYKFVNDSPDRLSERSSDDEQLTTNVKWISFKQKFFSQVLIAEDHFESGRISIEVLDNSEHLKYVKADMVLPFEHKRLERHGFTFYIGPNHYQEMEALNLELERQIPLGWAIFRLVNVWFVIPIFNFLNDYFVSFGLIILLLTLAIKLITLPLTFKSYLSMAKMKLLKPEIEELKEKHGKDMAGMQREQMKLYRKAGVNPLGGCIPMLLQLPILIAMFTFFPSSIELRHQGFLWADDLSSYDVIFMLPFEIPYYGSHVSLFTLLMAISTMFYTIMNNSMSSAQKEMKYIAYIMPVFLIFFFNSFASALTYYYFLFNVISIGQQGLMKYVVDEEDMKRKIEANKKKPLKKSKFQQKLEDMAKKQREMQEKKSNESKSRKKRR